MSLRVEKTISWLLRHGAIKENVTINNEGYVLINDLLSWLKKKNMEITLDDLINIVNNDTKGRLSILDNLIRANQGHSIDLKITLDKFKQNKSQIVHGTYYENYDSILKQGLKSMSRDYVHLINIDSKTNKFHMIRQDIDLYVFVQGDDLDFSISENGVILSADIPSKNLTLVPAYQMKKSGCYGFIIYDVTKTKVLIVETKSGKYGFPKGKINKGELPLCCAFRELKEETNLDPEDIIILPGCKSEVNEKNNVPTNYYLAQIRENITKELYCLDKEEDLKLHWVNISNLLKMNENKFYSRRKNLLIDKN